MPTEEEVSPGPHRDMLKLLHEVYIAAGPPGLRPIALGLKQDDTAPATLNHHAIGRVLRGKQLPGPRELTSLANWLFRHGNFEASKGRSVSEVLSELLTLREAAQIAALGSPTQEAVTPDRATSGGNREDHPETDQRERRQNDERRVLSSMLRSTDAIAHAAGYLKAEDFSTAIHKRIYSTLLELQFNDSAEVEREAVKRLAENPKAAEYATQLLGDPSDPGQAETYVEQLSARVLTERIGQLGRRIAEQSKIAAAHETPDADGLLQTVEDELIALADERHVVIGDVLERALFAADTSRTVDAEIALPSGFKDYDALYSGFRPGQLIVIGAATGIGKSTLALNLIRSCSLAQNKASFLVSLQMSREEVSMRLISAEARVSLQKMRTGDMTDDDWTRVANQMPSIAPAPIHIVDDPSYTVDQMIRACKRLRHFKDAKLIVVDSIDLLNVSQEEGTGAPDSDHFIVLRKLRQLAREINLPIVGTYQMGRIPSRHYIAHPEMHHLPASAERFADVILLLHREDAYEKESPRAGEADLIVAMNRYGPSSTIALAFQGHYSRFVDMSQEPIAPIVPILPKEDGFMG